MNAWIFIFCILSLFVASFSSESYEKYVQNFSEISDDEEYDDYEEDKRTNLKLDTSGRFSCHSCDPPDCSNPTICTNAVRCYTSHTRDITGHESKSKGCTHNHQTAMMYCSLSRYDGRHIHEKQGVSGQYTFTCCKGNLCNNATEWPELPDVPVLDASEDVDGKDEVRMPPALILAVVVPLVGLIVLAVVIYVVMRRCHRKRMEKIANSLGLSGFLEHGQAPEELIGLRTQIVGDSTLREFHNESDMTSGSGSGLPHLIPRTLAKQILLGERIGKGRYGEVWKGRWNYENVAVKIFYSRDEDSWRRETEIYSTVLLRHENILGYVGSDCTSQSSCTQLWLVTHFYANGSLYDFLNRDFGGLTSEQSFKIIMSSLTGLLHLHTEIFGTKGKPAIAHRDIKSKNILVRDDGSCVVADFGLAVMHRESEGRLDECQNSRVGTKRYMSPEVLDQSIDREKTIDAYRRVDIYAFALVMWEVMRRTRVFDATQDSDEVYALPFHNDVGPDPSFDDMRKVVCVEKKRPEFIERWAKNNFLTELWSLMQECWHDNPKVRHSALRLKKSLAKLDKSRPEQEEAPAMDHGKYRGISRD